MRANSSALSTIPSGVSPYRFNIRSLSEPVIRADPHRDPALLAKIDKWFETLVNPTQFASLRMTVGYFLS
jgi:hypothetical protein